MFASVGPTDEATCQTARIRVATRGRLRENNFMLNWKPSYTAALILWLLFTWTPASVRGQVSETHQATGTVSFTNEIAPIFLKKCQACHGLDKAKGEFQLHTIAALMK